MYEIVFTDQESRQPVTNSLVVASIFGKAHFNVVRDIRELLKICAEIDTPPYTHSEGVSSKLSTPPADAAKFFAETTYINDQNNEEYPMYMMNRDGFALLVMGYTGRKALQFKLRFIAAFNQMEQAIRQNVLAEQAAAAKPPLSLGDIARHLLTVEADMKKKDDDLDRMDREIHDYRIRENDYAERHQLLLQRERKVQAEEETHARLDRMEQLMLTQLSQGRNSDPLQPLTGKQLDEQTVYTVGRAAKRMRQDHPVQLSRLSLCVLYTYLRHNDYLHSEPDRYNRPTERTLRCGWMVYTRGGHSRGKYSDRPYITEKGYRHLALELIGHFGNQKQQKGGEQ